MKRFALGSTRSGSQFKNPFESDYVHVMCLWTSLFQSKLCSPLGDFKPSTMLWSIPESQHLKLNQHLSSPSLQPGLRAPWQAGPAVAASVEDVDQPAARFVLGGRVARLQTQTQSYIWLQKEEFVKRFIGTNWNKMRSWAREVTLQQKLLII